ncbi:hypothetical protein G6F22_019441 [Rhizopus arrhizus]|nr:hypothetical protein G6F22_019441 [Rhizopus arrhizus]
MGDPRIAGPQFARPAVGGVASHRAVARLGSDRQYRRGRARRRQSRAVPPSADHPEPGRRHRRGNPGASRSGSTSRPDLAEDRFHAVRVFAGREQRGIPVAAGQVGPVAGAGHGRALRGPGRSVEAGARPGRNGAQRLAGAQYRAERHRQPAA